MHLLLYMSILLTASAVYVPLQPRVDPCEAEVEEVEMVEDDAPTSDGTAGIGAEFESPLFYFVNQSCSAADTNAAKKQIVAGRSGTNWILTADTGAGSGKVNAEYILNGQNIKVGNGDAANAGAAAAQDLIGWHPWSGPWPNTVDIANNNCNPWKIDGPSQRTDPASLEWEPQVTAPMPLEALYSLMKEQLADPSSNRNVLDGIGAPGNFLVVVTQEYFQSNTNGIDGSKITDDVLGFCSLVLSYAKAATKALLPDQSPKLLLTFMPRTEFNTIYQQVKVKIPGDLFTLFNSLACYKTDKNGNVVVDKAYCSGPASGPISNNMFAALSYTNSAANPPASVNIKSWIQGIGLGTPSPDQLSAFDVSIDASIGGLGTKMEKMYNSQRSVPLFEFRDLFTIQTSQFESFMANVDSSIQALHSTFANPPQRRKRQAPSSCIMTAGTFGTFSTSMAAAPSSTTNPPVVAPSSTTNPPVVAPSSTTNPPVVAPVDPPSQPTCVPNPTTAVKDSHEGELQKAAKFFCDGYASKTVPNGPVNIAQTIISGTVTDGRETMDEAYLYTGDQNEDDVYDIKVTSVPNCTPTGGFNLATPVAKNQCPDILHSAWKQCDNQGRGGAITAGCLVYSIHTRY